MAEVNSVNNRFRQCECILHFWHLSQTKSTLLHNEPTCHLRISWLVFEYLYHSYLISRKNASSQVDPPATSD